jgi:hypothetical protein
VSGRNGGRKPKLSLEARMSVRRAFKGRPIHEDKTAAYDRLAELHNVSTMTIKRTVNG